VLTTIEATHAIKSAMPTFGTESVSYNAAMGRVLHQSVHAERDQPPFDRVMMDGIAIRHADFDAGSVSFRSSRDSTLATRRMHSRLASA